MNQPFGEYLSPWAHFNQWGIKDPPSATSLQIHPYFVEQVKKEKFYGEPYENPLVHLDKFVDNCDGAFYDEETKEYVYMKLFRLSLDGRARTWLKLLPPNSLTTWAEVTQAFMRRFYPEELSALMRRRIATFEQCSNETLGEAWERFRGMIRRCPHHGFNTGMRIRFFYDGLDELTRMMLDMRVGGSLEMVAVDELDKVIEDVVNDRDEYRAPNFTIKTLSYTQQPIPPQNTPTQPPTLAIPEKEPHNPNSEPSNESTINPIIEPHIEEMKVDEKGEVVFEKVVVEFEDVSSTSCSKEKSPPKETELLRSIILTNITIFPLVNSPCDISSMVYLGCNGVGNASFLSRSRLGSPVPTGVG